MSIKMQDWLSGKTGKAEETEKVDYYTREMAHREKKVAATAAAITEWRNTSYDKQSAPSNLEVAKYCVTVEYKTADSPYNHAYVEPIDLEMMESCLRQMQETNKPLPKIVVHAILRDIALLQSGREGEIFVRKGGHPTTHPDDRFLQDMVVKYAALAEKWGLDDDPKKTLEELGIKRSTYYSWRGSYSDDVWILASTKDEAKKEIRRIYDLLLKYLDPPE